jgi:hypothetical protein
MNIELLLLSWTLSEIRGRKFIRKVFVRSRVSKNRSLCPWKIHPRSRRPRTETEQRLLHRRDRWDKKLPRHPNTWCRKTFMILSALTILSVYFIMLEMRKSMFSSFWGDVTYDHNFLRFLPIFGKKICVFLKDQWYDQIVLKFGFVLSQSKTPIFS